jgi:hypothetical protein
VNNEGMTEKNIQEEIAQARKNFAHADATELRAVSVRYDREANKIVVDLRNGATFMFPPELAQGLADASSDELSDVQLTPAADGLHWPQLDVFLGIPLMMKGIFGSRSWMAKIGRKGGQSTSEAKASASRENGKKGGRPAKSRSATKQQDVPSPSAQVYLDANQLYESVRDYCQRWVNYECPNSYVVLLVGSGAGKSTLLNHLSWDWGRIGLGKRKLFFIDQLDDLNDFNYFKELFTVYARSLEDNLNDVEPSLRAHESMHYQLVFTCRNWIDKVQSFDAWESAQSCKLLIKSSLTWNAIVNLLVKRLGEYDLVTKYPHFTEKLLEPCFDFGKFATWTLERIDAAVEDESKALAASIVLAEQQIKASTCLLDAMIKSQAGPPATWEEDMLPARVEPFKFFEEQQKELLASGTVPVSTEYSALAGLSQSASVAERGVRCLAYASRYVELMRNRGKSQEPTAKTLEAFAHLPWGVAHDRRAFGTYVALLWALFEWTGLSREMSIDDDLFPKYKYKPIRTLKCLRDAFVHQRLWLTESVQTRRLSPQVKEALDSLGYSKLSESSSKYTHLQQNLLNELEPFLASMCEWAEQNSPNG